MTKKGKLSIYGLIKPRKQREGCWRATKKGGRGLQQQRGSVVAEAEYQEGRISGEVQGKINKELEGQVWIKEHRERGHL